jgi:CspA family cold shock protein
MTDDPFLPLPKMRESHARQSHGREIVSRLHHHLAGETQMSWSGTNNAAERFTGIVKFFKVQSGYGFINPQNGERDIFFHAADLMNFSQPLPGYRVSFTLGARQQRPEPRAGQRYQTGGLGPE